MGRNKAPSENTVRMLCSKSAGICEFEGCNKRLFFDGVTLSKFNNAYAVFAYPWQHYGNKKSDSPCHLNNENNPNNLS